MTFPDQDAPLVYVGPSIDGVAIRNTIYGDLPISLRKAIELRPYLSVLCVPVSGLAEPMKQIQAQSGYYYTLYSRATRESKKIQKGEN